MAIVTASVNPEKAQDALRRLVEEAFPEVAKDRERWMERALEIMEKEKNKPYTVAPVGGTLKNNSWARTQAILKNRKRRGH